MLLVLLILKNVIYLWVPSVYGFRFPQKTQYNLSSKAFWENLKSIFINNEMKPLRCSKELSEGCTDTLASILSKLQWTLE